MNHDHPDPDPDTAPPADLDTLSAYVDGELTPSQQAAVRAHLERDPAASARVAAWHAQKNALQALCGADARDGAPFVVLRTRERRPRRMMLAACWLVAGIGIGFAVDALMPRIVDRTPVPPAFARRADIAYAVYAPEKRHPVEVAADQEAHLINWLSKRLDRPLSVPSLQEYGYTLVGGRLLPGEAGPAAQFMYESGTGTRLTLYVTNIPKDETAFRLLRDGDRRTFYWVNDHLGYALSGAIDETKLRAIAIDVCGSLGGRPESWQ